MPPILYRLFMDSLPFLFWVLVISTAVCPTIEAKIRCDLLVDLAGHDNSTCGGPSSPCATIQQAVWNSGAGLNICVRGGPLPYSCPDNGQGVIVDKSLALLSVGAPAVVDCAGRGRAFWLRGSVRVSAVGFTLQNGVAERGGAILADGAEVTLTNCSFVNNTANKTGGGALCFCNASMIQVTGTAFVGNSVAASTWAAKGGGAVLALNAGVDPVAYAFSGNHFALNRNGTIVLNTTTLENSSIIFAGNRFSTNVGGAISTVGRLVQNSTIAFSDNDFAENAGGVVAISGNQGAIAFNLSTTVFVRNHVRGNVKRGDGAGVALALNSTVDSRVLVENNTFASNLGQGSVGGSGLLLQSFSTVSASTIRIRGNRFVNNSATNPLASGGAVRWQFLFTQSEKFDCVLALEDNVMIGNTAGLNGGAVSLDGYCYMGATVANSRRLLVGGTFANNTALNGKGGAVFISLCPENAISSPGVPISGWTYHDNWTLFRNVTFAHNTANCPRCMGGALNIESGQTLISGCRFEHNQAGFLGGGVVLGGQSTDVILDASLFTDNRAGSKGDALYSFASANLLVVESAFDQQESPVVDSVFYVAQGLPNNSTITRAEIRCPAGFLYLRQLSPQYSVPLAPWGSLNARSEVLKCKACPRDQYALRGGRLEADGSIGNVKCLECPGQADCSRGGADVYSLPGYWCGEASRSAESTSPLACTACPPGYCFDDAPRPWRAACTANRGGPLCGKCAPGHGEAFGIDECVPDQECLAVAWLLPAASIVGVAYVALVVWLPINHHPLWKSITYFMQTVPLVSSPDNVLLRVTMAVFALDPSVLGIHVTACPWAGLTAVEKMAADYLLPAMLLVELAVMLAGHRVFRWLQGQLPHRGRTRDDRGRASWAVNAETDDRHGEGEEDQEMDDTLDGSRPSTEYARYAGALTALVLLMYEGVTSATMDLLNCVPWDGALRLFRAGYVTCYAEWQYPLFAVLGGVLVPFPLLLVILRRWLSSRQRRMGSSASGWAVLHVLEGPYTRERAWWESVGMLRRLALLAVATFVPDPMWRALGLAAGCFVVLLSHAYLRPYADQYYGWAETLFLCDLTLVAVLQIPQATFAALGQPFEGAAAEAISDLQEGLALLPLAFCAYVLLRRYGLPLVHRLWSKRWGTREDAHDHQAPWKEERGHLHRQATRTEEHTTLLSSADGTEQEDGEGEDVALVSHRNNGERNNEEGPSLAQLVERQEGRFPPYLQRPSL